jgi:hypothetical protein
MDKMVTGSLRQRLIDANPMPYDETSQYRRFMGYFVPICIIVPIVLAYAVHYTSIVKMDLRPIVKSLFPPVRARLDFLSAQDLFSANSYAITFLIFIILALPIFCVHAVFYWRTVIAARYYRKVSKLTLLVMAYAICIAGTLFSILFLYVPQAFEPGRPGFARIIFWPLFPALSLSLLIFCTSVTLSLSVAIFKFTHQIGSQNGRT